jgi:hypothetical protein
MTQPTSAWSAPVAPARFLGAAFILCPSLRHSGLSRTDRFRQSAIGAVPSPVINISSMGFAGQPALALPSSGLRGADQRLAA